MGNCLGGPTIVIKSGDYIQYGDNNGTVVIIKKKEPTYTSNQLFDTDGQRGKSRRREYGRPMITEA